MAIQAALTGHLVLSTLHTNLQTQLLAAGYSNCSTLIKLNINKLWLSWRGVEI
jgi:hypothetical protein